MKKLVRSWFCDFWHPETESGIHKNPLWKLLSSRFDIILDDHNPDILFFGDSGFRHSCYDCLRIFYTGENLTPDYAACDLSLSYEPDSERNLYLPYFSLFDLSSLLVPSNSVEKTRFCNFIYSNHTCKNRNNFFRILSRYKKVDSGGRIFNNTLPPSPRDGDWHTAKIPFMRQYKFTIAFENMSYPGYITEKITDAFAARTIPIYWGCPNVAKTFNSRAFINCHDFPDFESVARHVAKADTDSAVYDAYLKASPFLENRMPAVARWSRTLDFLEHALDNMPDNLVSRSRWGTFLRVAPNFVAHKAHRWHNRKIRRPMKKLRLRQNMQQTVNCC